MTSSQTVFERIQQVVADQFGVNPNEVKPESQFVESFDPDSLDAVQLLMAVEDEFGVYISDEEAEKVITVQQAVDLVTVALS